MSQSIVAHLWLLAPLGKLESFGQALVRSGFLPATAEDPKLGPDTVDRILAGTDRYPDRTLWGFFQTTLEGPRIGVTTIDVRGERGYGTLVRLSASRSEIPPPETDEACGSEALAFEAASGRLFEVLKAATGYAAWSDSVDVPPLLRADVQEPDGRAFELSAVQRGILLELRAVNFLSKEWLERYSEIRDRFARLRVAPIGDYGWSVALTRCLVWNSLVHEDHFAAECGLDSCWKFTQSLNTHTPYCRPGT